MNNAPMGLKHIYSEVECIVESIVFFFHIFVGSGKSMCIKFYNCM